MANREAKKTSHAIAERAATLNSLRAWEMAPGNTVNESLR
jgi:hypothetical protein